jgi:hypothetical protein
MSDPSSTIKSLLNSGAVGEALVGAVLLLIASAHRLSVLGIDLTLTQSPWRLLVAIAGLLLLVGGLILQLLSAINKRSEIASNITARNDALQRADETKAALNRAIAAQGEAFSLQSQIHSRMLDDTNERVAELEAQTRLKDQTISNVTRLAAASFVIASTESDFSKEEIQPHLDQAAESLLTATAEVGALLSISDPDELASMILTSASGSPVGIPHAHLPLYHLARLFWIIQDLANGWLMAAASSLAVYAEALRDPNAGPLDIAKRSVAGVDLKSLRRFGKLIHTPALPIAPQNTSLGTAPRSPSGDA